MQIQNKLEDDEELSLERVLSHGAHGAAPFLCFWRFYPVKRPTANHYGGCSQMLVDGCQRPLDDIWCSGLMDKFFATNFILDLQKIPGLQ